MANTVDTEIFVEDFISLFFLAVLINKIKFMTNFNQSIHKYRFDT